MISDFGAGDFYMRTVCQNIRQRLVVLLRFVYCDRLWRADGNYADRQDNDGDAVSLFDNSHRFGNGYNDIVLYRKRKSKA